jgi:hypothetical protein
VCVFVCASLAVLSIGCRPFDLRGKGYGDQGGQTWTQNLRPPADERRFTGLDGRARDIERSLGVR